MKSVKLLLSTLAVLVLISSCDKNTKQDTGKVAEANKEEAKTSAPAISGVKKYTLKSGIIEYSYSIVGMEHKEVVSFDDYGMKECKDTYEDGVLKKSWFTDGEKIYQVLYKEKEAYIIGKSSRGTEFKVDWSEIGDREKKNGSATKLPNINILGKDCEQFSLKSGGTTTVFAGWGGVLLFMEQKAGYGKSIQKALKFDENANVPPTKFKVPDGFPIKS